MAIRKEEVTGIILAGGRSSRLGKDKGLCPLRGKPLVTYAIEILKPLCGSIVISANRHSEKYASFGYPVIRDEYPDIGPMGGIHACLKKSNTRHNFVLSCDMPFVRPEIFRMLLQEAEKNFQVVCPSHETFLVEPLSAYYNTNVLADMEEAIARRTFKMMQFFKQVRFTTVAVDESLPFFHEELFLNLNTPEDLEKAEEMDR